MVKQVDIQSEVAGCTAARLFELVYEGDAIKQYHNALHKDSNCEVTAWENGQRKVTFSQPLKMPDFIKRMVGVDSVRVCEQQTVVWQSEGKFSVASETNLLNMPGSANFSTSLHLVVSSGALEAGDCPFVQCLFSVKVVAGVPWPMAATLENVMAEQAKGSMSQLLQFASQLVEDDVAAKLAQQPSEANAADSDANAAMLDGSPMSITQPASATAGSAIFARPSMSHRRWPSQTMYATTFTVDEPSVPSPAEHATEQGPGHVALNMGGPGPLADPAYLSRMTSFSRGSVSGADPGFHDAVEHWTSGGASWSGSSGGADARDQLPAVGAPRAAPGQRRSGTMEGPGASGRDTSHDAALQQLVRSVQNVAVLVQLLDGKMDTVSQRLTALEARGQGPRPAGRRAAAAAWRGAAVVAVLLLVLLFVYYRLYPHSTGLLPRPPAPPDQLASWGMARQGAEAEI